MASITPLCSIADLPFLSCSYLDPKDNLSMFLAVFNDSNISFSIVIGNRTSPLLRLMEYSHMYVFIILVTNLSTLVNHSHAVLLLNVLNFHHADCL